MDQSKVTMSIFSRGSNFDSKGEEKEEEVAKMGETKGMMDLGGGQVDIGWW